MKKLLLFLLCFNSLPIFSQPQKVWLDADTGNEVDDVYAIIRLLWATEQYNITGLSAAHFNNADLVAFDQWNQYSTPGIQPVRISQALNEEILSTMGLSHIPHPMGADRQMGRAWGGYEPRSSAATEALQQVINKLKPGEKLDIITLGALTNIASLIALDTTVTEKIRVYSLGGGYDLDKKAWNKNEFNVRCDLNAFDFMMNQTGLDWTVMPISTVIDYRFEREETYQRFDDDRPVEQLMENRWRQTDPESTVRVMWDLGLVEAYLQPGLATLAAVSTPPENHLHTVKIYAKIDTQGLYKDFWQTVENHRQAFQAPAHKPKLGEIHLGNRVGGTLAQEGPTQQLICLQEGDQLHSIQTCLTPQQNVVKGIRMEVLKKDGKMQTYVFGDTTQGAWQPVYQVKKGQLLTGISGVSGWFVDSIRFHFNDGTTTPLYGGGGGDNDYQLILSRNRQKQLRGRWMGFWGSATNQLESIGLVFWPVE